MPPASPIRLDIGCGGRGTRYEGFTGVDLWPPPESDHPYVQLDFVHGELPWAPGSVDEAISLHVIEHLERADGVILIRRALELLKPNAFLTVTCPDLAVFARAYLAKDADFFGACYSNPKKSLIWPGTAFADKLNWAIHAEGHKWAYDYQSLWHVCNEAGAGEVRPLSTMPQYHTRKDHETGIVIIVDGDEAKRAHATPMDVEMTRRLHPKEPCHA